MFFVKFDRFPLISSILLKNILNVRVYNPTLLMSKVTLRLVLLLSITLSLVCGKTAQASNLQTHSAISSEMMEDIGSLSMVQKDIELQRND
jgi:hypothetical protein